MRICSVILSGALLCGWPLSGVAEATGMPAALRPGTHAMFATFNLGPAIEVAGNWGTQLKIAQEFGYHLSGRFEGPAIGISFEESFGNCTDVDGVSCFTFEIGPKVWWDIQPVADLGLYLTPMARIGFSHSALSYQQLDGSISGFGLQFGFAVRLVIGDRGLVFFRPFTLDMAIGGADDTLSAAGVDDNFFMRYDMMFGGGVIF